MGRKQTLFPPFCYNAEMRYTSKSLEDTKKLAQMLVDHLSSQEEAVVVALEGDLGSGKTTFSQCVGECLGVRDPIQSPTFLIEKIYELYKQPWTHLIHIDAYRLEREGELLALGWREIASKPENLILIEWADKVAGLLPEQAIRITFTFVDENTREIEFLEYKP